MAERFTDEQRAAIESRDGSVLVGAAAGSGKTTVLSERITQMLADESCGLDASRILVLTFSSAAAAEMRSRIKSKLNARLEQNPDDPYLKHQQRQLRRARISTVHAFCAQLIREYFSSLDLPLDFTILDENYADSLKRRAMEQAMETCYRDHPTETALLAGEFGRSRSDQEVTEIVSALDTFEQTLAWPEKWEEKALQDADPDRDPFDTEWGRYSVALAKEMLSDAARIAQELIRMMEGYPNPQALEDAEIVSGIRRYVEAGDWERASIALNAAKFPRLSCPKEMEEEEKDIYKKVRERMRNQIKDLKEKTLFGYSREELRVLMAQQLPLLHALFLVKKEYRSALTALKLDRKALEYDDLEAFALKLLYAEEGSFSQEACSVAACYDQIFVDEFQDTNERQEAIFNAVSLGRNNLFYVGDVKQSIYSFRRADPTIFIRLREEYEAHKGDYPRYIALPQNFRSSGPVIDAVNKIFDPLMTKNFGGSDYAGADRLLKGRDIEITDPIGMELQYFTGEKEEEAAAVAQRIRQMLTEQYPVKKGDTFRPCRAEDFCILLRTAVNNYERFRKALEDLNIPCRAPGSEAFFDCSEIRIMVSLLRVVDNPRRDVDLAAVMLSPIGTFTMDDLVALRLKDRRKKLWQLLLMQEDEQSEEFVEKIRSLRAKAAVMSVAEFIGFAMTMMDAETLLTAPPESEARKERLHALIDYAAGYAQYGGRDLRDFLRHCEQAEEQGKGPATSVSAGSGVTITTIHKAKGLEWPVVILADAGHGFNFQDSNIGNGFFDAVTGAGFKLRMEDEDGFYMKESPSAQAIRRKKRSDTVSEELRVLYVALTRAQQKILVTATLKGNRKERTADMLREQIDKKSRELMQGTVLRSTAVAAGSPLDWILLSYCAAGFTGDLPENEAVDIGPLRIVLRTEGEEEEDKVQEIPVYDTETLTAEIEKRLAFRYPYEWAAKLPTKVTVTELSHNEGEKKRYYTRPSFMRGGQLAAVERGTAVHRFMELCDYRAAAEDPEKEIERLRSGQFLEDRVIRAIRPEQIRAFFQSDIGVRLLRAERVLREYPFLDQVPASEVDQELPADSGEKVLIQGVADAVLIEKDRAVILDFKTDRVDNIQELGKRYRKQMYFYSRSISEMLELPIKECFLWSFHLDQSVRVTFLENT